MPALSEAELFAKLSELTGLDAGAWTDILACTPEQQAVILQTYADADWHRSPDVLSEVLAVLTVIGTVAGVVGGVAGAAGAIQVLSR